ncbi:MAG: acyl-[acyl-carrier-protein]--UDP-N-acetylglucosamine O-acyltransferase [Lysobacterales bacterium CG02_land_8_20_14_3_00_62_12]|nr:MAG: acyl-[acyl-carrier-protein]--UDP-N-acetylglucosamine O-acyltransferase [Xanthomonadales bacterium CG02_land_8_20_14_3_00_62_12]
MIHPTACIDARAQLGANVSVGPFCVIGANVDIGAGTVLGSHVVIEGPTRIGRDNRFFPFCSIGADPQDKKYQGETTRLEIGDGNTFRESMTVHRGTAGGGGVTRIGNDNWLMAYVHIAHDCRVGDHTVIANAAALAGHVSVDDYAILGGYSLVHQFCRVGAHAFTSMGSVINRDVPPFFTVAGHFAEPKGINSEGLKRRGFSADQLLAVKRAYKTLYLSGLPLAEARNQIAQAAAIDAELQLLVDFIDRSERGLVR